MSADVLLLELHRKTLAARYSLGVAILEGVIQCYTLEDTYRPPPQAKIPKETCIPVGDFNLEITKSARFSQLAGHDVLLPLLWNVLTPDGRKLVVSADGRQTFEGIRWHTGISIAHTEGCVLTGTNFAPKGLDLVELTGSGAAYVKLFGPASRIAKHLAAGGRVTCRVTV
jgi:hypothetical protein